jgi:hypothetical protein
MAVCPDMSWFCSILTLALNTSGGMGHRIFGTAVIDAVGPMPLIGWSEVGLRMLRQIYAVCAQNCPGTTVTPVREYPQPDALRRHARPGARTLRRTPHGRQTCLPGHPSRSPADRARSRGRPVSAACPDAAVKVKSGQLRAA